MVLTLDAIERGTAGTGSVGHGSMRALLRRFAARAETQVVAWRGA